jgi:hypothetical protein
MNAICPTCGNPYFKDQPWKKTYLNCWRKRKNADTSHERVIFQPVTEQPAIPADMLARLIRLCHPDKHGNSEAANQATAYLLAQREMAR